MSGELQILVSTPARRRLLALAALAGSCLLAACGQKGPLYMPTGAEAAGRRTLPQTLTPTVVAPPQRDGAPGSTPSAATSPPAVSQPPGAAADAETFPSTPGAGTASPTRQP